MKLLWSVFWGCACLGLMAVMISHVLGFVTWPEWSLLVVGVILLVGNVIHWRVCRTFRPVAP